VVNPADPAGGGAVGPGGRDADHRRAIEIPRNAFAVASALVTMAALVAWIVAQKG
jgi:hypothetical protein